MDVTDILPQLERLDGEIDDAEEVLEPLLGNLAEVASKLPLLDKAKLYVLITYALESMLFSSLRLNGVDAKEHPVFKELTRVRQYFEKIKNIENPPPKPEQSLNKEAAIRFIRSDLADNKEANTKLSELIAKERAKAAVKAAMGKRKADVEPEQDDEEMADPDDEDEEDKPREGSLAAGEKEPTQSRSKASKPKKTKKKGNSKKPKKTS
ncbi:Sas10/Utp3/C1D family-domain-containing protein [Xylariales sp. PMI_506]|nr:Sas10/Utp3/C1D family-domain-containing protein [Xylariales sp. PMI_506]